MHITTQGLVLREVNYKESDKILTILTAGEGKRTVKARGCRRKGSQLAAAAQLLVYSEMTLFDYRDHCTLSEASTLREFRGLRENITLLALGSYFAEVAETVAQEGREDPGVLSLILNSLYALDALGKPPALVKAAFELKLMCLIGYEPLLDACAVCGLPHPERPAFHLRQGVLHCAACREGAGPGESVSLDGGALAAMRHIVYGDPKRLFSFQIGAESMGRLGAACQGFLLTQLERGFRTLDFYRQLAGTI